MPILIATHNQDKRAELHHMLIEEFGGTVEVLTLDDIHSTIGEIPETGSTLEENALIKARTVFEQTRLPTVADDTGLEVRALGGAPGVYSARYSGEGATYASNVRKLLRELENNDDREATFATVIAYIDEASKEHLFRGEVKGKIARAARGSNGFGYDPIFIPEPAEKTFAEMTESEKNAISHRGRALRTFTEFLKSVK